jgi:hypothetical protein
MYLQQFITHNHPRLSREQKHMTIYGHMAKGILQFLVLHWKWFLSILRNKNWANEPTPIIFSDRTYQTQFTLQI